MFELFQHASSKDLIESNPAMLMVLLALPKKPTQHNSFLRQEEPAFLVKLSGSQDSPQTRLEILLLVLTRMLSGELHKS